MTFTQKEIAEYEKSLALNLRALAGRGALFGMVREVHDDLAKRAPKGATFSPAQNAILIPIEAAARAAYERALATSTHSAGGAFVGGTQMPVWEMLRPASIFMRGGARLFTGLSGNLTVGREGTESAFTWMHELETGTASDPTFGAAILAPRRLFSHTKISAQADMQSDGRVRNYWLSSLGVRLADALDLAGFQGDGLAQPKGVFSRTDTNQVTFGAAATWAKALSFEAKLSEDDVNPENVIFAANGSVREKWGNVLRHAAGSDATLWNVDNGTVAGRRAYTSSNVPSARIVALDASQTAFGIWGDAYQAVINPFTSAMTDQIEMTVSAFADFALLNANAACIGTDSANR